MDASIIDQNIVHLEIRLFGVLFVLELDEGVTQRVTGLLVTNDFTAENLAEATENRF